RETDGNGDVKHQFPAGHAGQSPAEDHTVTTDAAGNHAPDDQGEVAGAAGEDHHEDRQRRRRHKLVYSSLHRACCEQHASGRPKTTNPVMNTCRRTNRSAARPASSNSPPKVTR